MDKVYYWVGYVTIHTVGIVCFFGAFLGAAFYLFLRHSDNHSHSDTPRR